MKRLVRLLAHISADVSPELRRPLIHSPVRAESADILQHAVTSQTDYAGKRLAPRPTVLNVQDYIVDPLRVTTEELRERMAQDGILILEDVLSEAECDALSGLCVKLEQILIDSNPKYNGGTGKDGPGRYSLGNCSAIGPGHCIHFPEFLPLLNCPKVLHVLDLLYGAGGYECAGGGGDFVRAGNLRDQALHADGAHPTYPQLWDVPLMGVNFAVRDISVEDGPMRVLPGKRWSRNAKVTRLEDETFNSLRSTLAPMRKGSCLVRDCRLLHGGTQNLSRTTRFMPNVEYCSSKYVEAKRLHDEPRGKWIRKCLPPSLFVALSPKAKDVCKNLVLDEDIPPQYFVAPQGSFSQN